MTDDKTLSDALASAARIIAINSGAPDHYIMGRRAAEDMGLMDCVSHAVTDKGDFIPIEDCIDPGGIVAVSTALMKERRKEPK